MKKFVYSSLLISLAFIFTTCEPEPTGDAMLNNLTAGEMGIVINNGDGIILDCNFINYYENDLSGEVLIDGNIELPTAFRYFTISYGSLNNEIPLAIKTYSSAETDNKISVDSSYGVTDENAVITMQITEITDDLISGNFSGKLNSSYGLMSVKGAFHAIKKEE